VCSSDLVKTGFKYGAHFRVYDKTPDADHAKYLVHSVPRDKVMMWPEISRTVRLSGGVKKEILFCRTGEPMEYLEFKWFRP
jgi:tRNA-intron endonuclease